MTVRAFLGFSLLLAAGASGAEVTFSHDVAPIVYKHCVSCHHPNDIAPMSLLTYRDARPWAAAMKEAVVTGKMPPWKADATHGKWSNDARLSEVEKNTLLAWANGSKAEGNPKDMPPMPSFPDGWKIGKPDSVISIPPQNLSAGGPDEYTYIDVPTGFTEDKWVVAAELRPGNRKVVHHAHVFVVEPESTEAQKKNDPDPVAAYSKWLKVHEGSLEFIRPDAPVINDGCARDDNGAFPGSKQGDLGSLISSFLPGREADVYPEGTARLVKAGSKVRFQIHYSKATGKPETDVSSIGMRFSKEPPRQIARRVDLSNHMFQIPAGASDQEVSECHTFQKDLYITSLTPHMHLRGKAMRFDVTYPDGRTETLLNVPQYDFNWQITYRTATPIFIPKGTRLKIDARFDNSPNKRGNPDPSKVIRWGAASEVEMMDGWVEYVDRLPEEPAPAITTDAANRGSR